MPATVYTKDEVDALLSKLREECCPDDEHPPEPPQPPAEPPPDDPGTPEPGNGDGPVEPVPAPSGPIAAIIPPAVSFTPPEKPKYILDPALITGKVYTGKFTVECAWRTTTWDQWAPLPQTRILPEHYRVLVDNVPIVGHEIDPADYEHRPHVVYAQPLVDLGAAGGSRVVIFGEKPATETRLPFVLHRNPTKFDSSGAYILASPRPTIQRPSTIDLARLKASKDGAWIEQNALHCVDGFPHHWPTPYDGDNISIVKAKDGTVYPSSYNPKGHFDFLAPYEYGGLDYIATFPGHDGIGGTVSGYAHVHPGHRPLSNGEKGFMFFDPMGRCGDMDLDGVPSTWYGWRNKGIPAEFYKEMLYDPKYRDSLGNMKAWVDWTKGDSFELRVASGEKEFVGNPENSPRGVKNGWPDFYDHDMHYLACESQDRVAMVCRKEQKVLKSWPTPRIKWVTSCKSLRQEGLDYRFLWSSDEGIFGVRMDDTEVKLFDIPARSIELKERWSGSVLDTRLYAISRHHGIWECNLFTGESHNVIPDSNGEVVYPFLFFDANGTLTKKDTMFYGPGGTNEGINVVKIGEWKPRLYNPALHPNHMTLDNGWTGHYGWGGAVHEDYPVAIFSGTSNSAWHRIVAYTGEQPPVTPIDEQAWRRGRELWLHGVRDKIPALSALYGFYGGGEAGHTISDTDFSSVVQALGYTPEQLSDIMAFRDRAMARAHYP